MFRHSTSAIKAILLRALSEYKSQSNSTVGGCIQPPFTSGHTASRQVRFRPKSLARSRYLLQLLQGFRMGRWRTLAQGEEFSIAHGLSAFARRFTVLLYRAELPHSRDYSENRAQWYVETWLMWRATRHGGTAQRLLGRSMTRVGNSSVTAEVVNPRPHSACCRRG